MQACPKPDCNKKVVDQSSGKYRCEKCQTEFESYKWRIILNVSNSTSTHSSSCSTSVFFVTTQKSDYWSTILLDYHYYYYKCHDYSATITELRGHFTKFIHTTVVQLNVDVCCRSE